MKTPISAVILCALLLPAVVFQTANSQTNDTAKSFSAIPDARTAYERAIAYTGFDQAPGFTPAQADSVRATARLIVVNDTNKASFNELIIGRKAWAVKFSDIIYYNGAIDSFPRPTRFEVLIDANSGQLLRIKSNFAGYDPGRSSQVPPELQVGDPPEPRQGMVNCSELSKNIPFRKFIEILSPDSDSGRPIAAKQISAYFVQCSFRGGSDKRYWYLVFRGGKPFMGMHSKKPSPYVKGSALIDDSTGFSVKITIN